MNYESQLDQLERSFAAVGSLIGKVGPDQWNAPTPCSDWSVRRLVQHLVGMNRVFAAMLNGDPPPSRDEGPADEELDAAFHDSAAALVAAFGTPGVLETVYESPMGKASGLDRLSIRLYDLLAHGWDLAQATGQRAELPEDATQQALAFARLQVKDEERGARFAPARPVSPEAPAIDQLAAFLGRSF